MIYRRTEHYKGYNISGDAFPTFERWRSIFTVERTMYQSEAIAVTPLCETPEGAVQQALKVARKMVDSAGFTLSAANQPSMVRNWNPDDALPDLEAELLPAFVP